MILHWKYTHTACACQSRPCPAPIAVHGKREATISLPGPHESLWALNPSYLCGKPRRRWAEDIVVAIQRPSYPRWNPPRTGPAVTVPCVVMAARQILAGPAR
jgi:hypothetical protein